MCWGALMKIYSKLGLLAALPIAMSVLSACSVMNSVSKNLYTDVEDIKPSAATKKGLQSASAELSARNAALGVLGIPAGSDTFEFDEYEAMAVKLMSLPQTNATQAQKTALGVQMLSDSDRACNRYLTQISANERITKTSLGLTGLALTATSGALKQGTTTAILSNIATFAQGTEAELEKELLGGKAAGELIRAVKVGREVYRARLVALLLGGKNANDDVVNPSFERFYLGFPEYHDSCGITYGLAVVEDALQNQTEQARSAEPVSGTGGLP